MRRAAYAVVATISVAAAARAEDAPTAAHGFPFTLHASASFGDGLRFNDPYRLATVLGSSAETVSRTSSYVDLAWAITLGDPRKFQNGFSLGVTIALEGVQQTVLTPSYVLYRRFRTVAAFARAATPIVCTPEITWGFEGALGGIWFVRGGIGLVAELVGDVFYGAGTREVSAAAYPVLSGQLGVTFAWEVVP